MYETSGQIILEQNKTYAPDDFLEPDTSHRNGRWTGRPGGWMGDSGRRVNAKGLYSGKKGEREGQMDRWNKVLYAEARVASRPP